jgi:hypothetical protein
VNKSHPNRLHYGLAVKPNSSILGPCLCMADYSALK